MTKNNNRRQAFPYGPKQQGLDRTMKLPTALCLAAALVVVSACSKKPSEITATYVSPAPYQKMNCEEISDEVHRVSRHARELTGQQESKAERDTMVAAGGILLFWPALFFLGGSGASEAEIAQLKGTMNALEDASRAKKCGIRFR